MEVITNEPYTILKRSFQAFLQIDDFYGSYVTINDKNN